MEPLKKTSFFFRPAPRLRLLALVQKPPGLSPGQRFRLEQWAPHLQKDHGIDLDFSPFESPELTEILYRPGLQLRKARLVLRDTLRRALDLGRAAAYDGVIVYREAAALGPAFYETLLCRRGVPLIYDFDDAIWIPVAGSPNGAFARLRFAGKTAAICRMARLVTVGNPVLARYAREVRGQGDADPGVAIVPTSVELARYPLQALPALPQPRSPAEPFVVVWSGSHSTVPYLEALREPLASLGRERRVVLRVIANAPPARPFANVINSFVPWREDEEAAAISAAHAGVMPLPDDVFTRGKCGLKALLYMACGVPAVVSPVGANRDIVTPGVSGLWAQTSEDWLRALRALAASEPAAPAARVEGGGDDGGGDDGGDEEDRGLALRTRLAEGGRRVVEEHYRAERSAARFAAAVRRALRPETADQTEAPELLDLPERPDLEETDDPRPAQAAAPEPASATPPKTPVGTALSPQ